MKHHWIWILLILFISGCGQGYDWGWYVVSPLHPQGQTNIQFLISGLWYTLLLSVMAILLSIVLGLLIALMTLTKHSFLRKVNRVYVEIFRSIPILVMLLWVYYGLPPALGIRLDVLWAGVLAWPYVTVPLKRRFSGQGSSPSRRDSMMPPTPWASAFT